MGRKFINRRLLTKKEKKLWNEAVTKTCRELLAYDGLVPEEHDRIALSASLKKRLLYTRGMDIVADKPLRHYD